MSGTHLYFVPVRIQSNLTRLCLQHSRHDDLNGDPCEDTIDVCTASFLSPYKSMRL